MLVQWQGTVAVIFPREKSCVRIFVQAFFFVQVLLYPEADLGGPHPGALFNGRDRERKASSLQYHGYKIIKISRISCTERLTSGAHILVRCLTEGIEKKGNMTGKN